MNKRIALLILFSIPALWLSAQLYDTTFYNIKFVSAGEGMWNSGSTDILPAMEKDYSFSWNESTSIGGIESVLGMDFGARLYGKTAGTIGMGFYMSDINGGEIDSIIYPIDIQFMVPKSENISAGQTIKISSRVNVNDTQKPSIETTFPLEAKVGVNMTFDLNTDLNFKICAFDACLKIDPKIIPCVPEIMDFEFDQPILEVNTFNSDPRIIVPKFVSFDCVPDLGFHIPCIGDYNLFGEFNYKPTTDTVSFFPIEFGLNRTLKSKHPLSKYYKCMQDTANLPEDCINIGNLSKFIKGRVDLEDFLKGYFSLPYIDTLFTTVHNNNLFSVGSDTALSMEFKPLNLIAKGKFHDGDLKFTIPCTSKDFYVHYMLIRPTMNLDVIAKQDLKFDADVIVSLELPAQLQYKVCTPSGKVIKSGADNVITYTVGNDLYVDFPCNYEYIDFKPTFRVQNNFTNRTYASLNMDGHLQAIEVGIKMDEITVVPELEICIPNPFGSDWCTTIPSVKFGFNASVGPLIDESISNFMSNPDDLNIEVDIFNDSWEIESFQKISTSSFRVAPSRFIASVAPDTILCNGETNGRLEAKIQNGTPPYSYLWSNNSRQKQVTSLPAGEHYVKVTDRNGCVAFNGASVYEYPALKIESTDIFNPDCYGDETGRVDCRLSGGKPPYIYNWSDGSAGARLENVLAGDYSLSLKDKNGCNLNQEFTIHQPPQLQGYVNNKTDVLCSSENTGSIKINVSGGVPGYDYFWSNGSISKDVDSLYAGNYSVKVVDRNNCSIIIPQMVNEPSLLSAIIEVQKPISCFKGVDGELFANIQGGVKPYSITWYNPQHMLNSHSSVLGNLEEGLFQMEVYDSHNCYRIDTLYLEAPQIPFRSELKETQLSCNHSEDGKFELSIFGGSPPYSFLWSDGSNKQNRTGLSAGPYSVAISDSKSCITQNNMVLLEPYEIKGIFNMKPVSCEGEEDGTLEFIPKGGTPPYSYYWSDGTLLEEATNLSQGLHSVLISDSKTCEKLFECEVGLDGSNCFDIPNAFSPNGDSYNDTWVIKNILTQYPNHVVSIYTPQGNLIYTSGVGGYVPWDGKRNGNELPSGTYFFIIDFGNGSDPYKGTLTIVR